MFTDLKDMTDTEVIEAFIKFEDEQRRNVSPSVARVCTITELMNAVREWTAKEALDGYKMGYSEGQKKGYKAARQSFIDKLTEPGLFGKVHFVDACTVVTSKDDV